jgi:hypothetical protein
VFFFFFLGRGKPKGASLFELVLIFGGGPLLLHIRFSFVT